MSRYPCPHCGTDSQTFADARAHVAKCPRLGQLGGDLELAVLQKRMTLEEAEAEQARRPKLRL